MFPRRDGIKIAEKGCTNLEGKVTAELCKSKIDMHTFKFYTVLDRKDRDFDTSEAEGWKGKGQDKRERATNQICKKDDSGDFPNLPLSLP